MILLYELLSDFIYEDDSDASKEAKQLGLVYKKFGRWADPRTDKVTHKTDNGRLVPLSSTSYGIGDDEESYDDDDDAFYDDTTKFDNNSDSPLRSAIMTSLSNYNLDKNQADGISDEMMQIIDDWMYQSGCK